VQELYGLQLATQSQVDNARKALLDAQENVAAQRKVGGGTESATLTAPFAGVITAVSVGLGDRIQAGASVLQIGHVEALRVQLGLEPSDARLVRKGMPVQVAPLQDETQVLPGVVAVAQDILDPKTQLFNVIVQLQPGSAGVLMPGMRVRASIATSAQDGWVLPRQAVLSDDHGSYVFQVASGRARRVAVQQQQDGAKEVGVSGPIRADLPVVVLGNYEIQDGMKVREGAR
jgi:RND family efflux transporter MFP subunit